MPDRTPSRSAGAAARRRVLALLKEDHQAIAAAFDEVDAMQPPIDALELRARVDAAIARLAAHAVLEETIFYPAVREAAGERVDEAEVEHASMASLTAQIQAGGPADSKYVARFKVLGEYLRHHVHEEEGALFAALEGSPLRWEELELKVLALREPPAPPVPAPAKKRAAPRRDQNT